MPHSHREVLSDELLSDAGHLWWWVAGTELRGNINTGEAENLVPPEPFLSSCPWALFLLSPLPRILCSEWSLDGSPRRPALSQSTISSVIWLHCASLASRKGSYIVALHP